MYYASHICFSYESQIFEVKNIFVAVPGHFISDFLIVPRFIASSVDCLMLSLLWHYHLVLLLLLGIYCHRAQAYLHEPHPPFTITRPLRDQLIHRGETVTVTWELSAGTKFPLYGYASARTSHTIAGLLPANATHQTRYLHHIERTLSFSNYSYQWTVDEDIPVGEYRLGIGFYFHQVSPVFRVT
ncbi:uncharacterized protein BYT42DRAFT_142676 [Radiomyces spectabilis]|uniref:uncharacterized protein n=1 Tax=Radiomyces spectabilis TaxID=64574 RepID=UPI0022200E2C|nr:uncharacterized protein BYT42DRAFT_142676 [Radiomyces spectabilis]KAI8366763.1 hypothetical protein BYT42DRAFT_142676 [Radiomyces spectabilis]